MTPPDDRDRRTVAALARGIGVITAFGAADTWLGNAEIAGKSGLPKATVSRITSTLTQLGYLRYSGSLRKYRLGPAVLSLGYTALADLDVRKVARVTMQELADAYSGVVGLFARDGFQVMQLEACHSATSVLSFRLDERGGAPLLHTAFGQALLWSLREQERESVVRQLEDQVQDEGVGVRQRLGHTFAALQRDGYCVTYGRWQRDVNTIGVPVELQGFEQPLALGFTCLVGHPARVTLQTQIAPRLAAAAAKISRDVARLH